MPKHSSKTNVTEWSGLGDDSDCLRDKWKMPVEFIGLKVSSWEQITQVE